ncbi:MAG: hypothetical protein AAF518_14485 [Spirochaetota bacterium]
MAWVGDDQSGYFNDTGFALFITEDGRPVLYSEELEYEDIDFFIPLEDLFFNPYFNILVLDKDGKIPDSVMPSIRLGNTFEVDSEQQMLDYSINHTIGKGDICLRRDIPGGASLRLMVDPEVGKPTQRQHWVELVSRFVNWNDIKFKPLEFPALQEEFEPGGNLHHAHEQYARLYNGKILPEQIPQIEIGNRHKAFSIEQMLSLVATTGDVCTLIDRARGINQTYILFGQPYNLDDWEPFAAPEGKVDSVNGKGGIVYLEAADVGAAEREHQHDDRYYTKAQIVKDRLDLLETINGEFGNYYTKGEVDARPITEDGGKEVKLWQNPANNHLYFSTDGGANYFPFA